MTPHSRTSLIRSVITLGMTIALCAWSKQAPIVSSWQGGGGINITIAAALLCGFLTSGILSHLGIPKITGYIVAGVVAGPYATGFLDFDTVGTLQLVNELALSFIALHAGAALDPSLLSGRTRALVFNLLLQSLIVPLCVFGAVMVAAPLFAFTSGMATPQRLILATLSAIIALARSPSSAMAIITECRARGPFTETALGVTVAMDVLAIILFTVAMATVLPLLGGEGGSGWHQAGRLSIELVGSLAIGLLLGFIIRAFYRHVGNDHALFLLFVAFAVARLSELIGAQLSSVTDLHLTLEPLLICITAGVVVRYSSPYGESLEETLVHLSLPIYVLFFTVAGASLDLNALSRCWPLALILVGSRAAGMSLATWSAGHLAKLPPSECRLGGMVHLTQACVAIGLTQIVAREAPDTAVHLTTLTLAAISLNQLIGPVAFKRALTAVGEAGQDRR